MRCLTVCEPYALAISWGVKHVENRTWPTNHRGPLLIHAGKSKDWLDTLSAAESDELLACCRKNNITDLDAELRFGQIVGVVDVVACVTMQHVREHDRTGTAWHSGPWCWVLANARRFSVGIPYLGSQGLFNVPDGLVERSLAAPVGVEVKA